MKASDYRKLQASKPTLTAKVALPSGAIFVLRRPPLDLWTRAGKVPDFFVRMALESEKGKAATDAMNDLSADEVMQSLGFMREVLLYSVVEPKLKQGATDADDALDPAELDEADVEYLTSYILFKGCPDIPVLTKESEVSVQSLATFRQKRPGGGFVGDVVDSETYGHPPVGVVANTG